MKNVRNVSQLSGHNHIIKGRLIICNYIGLWRPICYKDMNNIFEHFLFPTKNITVCSNA